MTSRFNLVRIGLVLLFALGAIALIAAVGTGITVRFQHPEFTETQLFLANWKLYLLGIAGGWAAFIALCESENV